MTGHEFPLSLKRISVLKIWQHCSGQLVSGFKVREEFAEVCYKGPKIFPQVGVGDFS